MHVMVSQSNGGGTTGYSYWVPNPQITFWTSWNGITSDDWPNLIPIQFTVDDLHTPESPDYQATIYSQSIPEDPARFRVIHDIPLDAHLVQPGDVLVMDNGQTTRELIVSSLQITNVDMDADMVIRYR